MSELVCFGELMLRLSTPGHLRFAQAQELQVNFGGAEANVATAVAQLGGDAAYVTRLPRNEIADRALAELRGLKVDVTHVARGGERMGVYFVEHGASLRASRVLYDRAHSAIAEAGLNDFDWNSILQGARWFHWSGITPALSSEAAALCGAACEAARARGITVSFDVNYRSKLWTPGEAGHVLSPLMRHVDLCITSAEEARSIFGLEEAGADAEMMIARQLCEKFGFQSVALTQRRSASADQTEWGAMLYTGGAGYLSSRHHVGIVDRLGGGDSFSGGLIFALLRGDEPAAALELAAAAGALKHTIYGDYNLISLAEVEALMAGASGGRVQR